tara:strand:- start:37 stop:246 length:210 start_codon:yes stop_codon:yes gene_type:complete
MVVMRVNLFAVLDTMFPFSSSISSIAASASHAAFISSEFALFIFRNSSLSISAPALVPCKSICSTKFEG